MNSFDFSFVAIEFALNWFLQSSLLILLGTLAAHLLRQHGSAVQSAIYRTTLVAVLVCPLATWGLSQAGVSGWSVRLPDNWRTSQMIDRELDVAQPTPALQPNESFDVLENAELSNDTMLVDVADGVFEDLPVPETLPDVQPVGQDAVTPPAPIVTNLTSDSNVPEMAVASNRRGLLFVLLLGAWLLIAIFMLIRLLSSWRQMAKLRDRAFAAEESTIQTCRELALALGVAEPKVMQSPYLPSPCLTGLIRPTVLLPEGNEDLSIREVLIHELAHLLRRDCHWNLLRQVATSLFFFQPLLWYLSRQIETSAEEVCDDYVVQHGGDRREYAYRLADIAELSTAPVASAGVGIVSFRSMLATRVTRILDTSRSLSTRVGNLLLALVLIGGLIGTTATGLVGLSAHSPKAIPANDSESDETIGDTDQNESTEISKINGTVVDPDGNPVSGARVYANLMIKDDSRTPFESYNDLQQKIIADCRTGSTGEFELDWSQVSATDRKDHGIQIVAIADGFGPTSLRSPKETESTLRLTRSKPVQGRILDLEGKPLSGISVSVFKIHRGKNEKAIQEWIEDSRKKTPPKRLGDYWMMSGNAKHTAPFPADWNQEGIVKGSPVLPAPVQTDEDGKFQLKGLGVDQVAILRLEGESIATSDLQVVTRDMRPLHARPIDMVGIRSDIYYGRMFEYVADTGQTAAGTVTDSDTGEPLANVKVRLNQFADNTAFQSGYLTTQTDANGKFELKGLPQGGGHTIETLPDIKQPFLSVKKTLPKNSSSFDPIQCEFKLKKGKWVVGKLTESKSGQPVENVSVEYLPTRDNKHATEYPHYQPEITGYPPSYRYKTDENGEFRVLAIPGRGILATVVSGAEGFDYEKLSAANLQSDLVDRETQVKTYHPWVITGYNSLIEVNLEDNLEEVTHDLTITKGATKTLKFVDRLGNPVKGVRVLGRRPNPSFDLPTDETQVELLGMSEDEQRVVGLVHPEKKIGKVLTVSADDGEQTIKLEPCAIARGRIVQEDGDPVAEASMKVTIDNVGDNWHRQLGLVTTDKQGRFEAVLPPGRECRVWCYNGIAPEFSAEFEPEAGAIYELGDVVDGTKLKAHETRKLMKKTVKAVPFVKAVPLAKASAKPAQIGATANSATDTPEEINGRVVDVDKKPIAGAQLFWFDTSYRQFTLARAKLIATTDEQGRFQLDHSSFNATPDGEKLYKDNYRTVVRAPGHSVLKRVHLGAKPARGSEHTIVLQPDGKPLRGRIVDVDGKGVVGATVKIRDYYEFNAHRPVSERAVDYASLSSEKLNEHCDDGLLGVTPQDQMLNAMPGAVTDDNGRFEISGIGSDRLFHLIVQGENIETVNIFARNQPGDKLTVSSDLYNGRKYELHSDEILHIAGPSKPIEGQVVDVESGEPIADALVIAASIGNKNTSIERTRKQLTTRTDAQGKFRITGLPLTKSVQFICWCDKHEDPYPFTGLSVDTTQPGETLDVKFPVKRGVWVEGRVFDADSNKPLLGFVNAFYFRNPELEKEIRLFGTFIQGAHRTYPHGNFRIPVHATRGILAFRLGDSPNFSRYPRGAGAAQIEGMEDRLPAFPTVPIYLMANNYSQLLEIHPDGTQETIKIDVPLSSGHRIVVKPKWPDRVEATEYRVYGSSESWRWDNVDSPSFEVKALESGEERNVFVFSREHDLVGAVTVSAPEESAGKFGKPVEVRMERAGQIVGRLVDADGEPITDAKIGWDLKAHEQPGWGAWPPDPNNKRGATTITTDDEGRFRITGIVPGWKYASSASADRKWYTDTMASTHIGIPFDNVTVEPGEVKDLGDLVTKPESSD